MLNCKKNILDCKQRNVELQSKKFNFKQKKLNCKQRNVELESKKC